MTFHFKDYHKGGARSFKKLPVLVFVDRLIQYLPEKKFRQVRHYGLFSNAKRTEYLSKEMGIMNGRVLDAGCWMLDTPYLIIDVRCRSMVFGHWLP